MAEENKNEPTAWQEDFHRYGLNITRKVLLPVECGALLDEMKRLRFKPIFNHDQFDRHTYNDNLRLQSGNIANHVNRCAPFARLVSKMQFMVGQKLPLLHCKDLVALKSLPGCQEQPMHMDYELDTPEFDHLPPTSHPCAAIIALQDGTLLPTWPRLADGSIVRYNVELNKGDVLWFRGDLVHAGAEYGEQNVRIHAFLDHHVVKRRRNATSIIEYAHPELFEAAIHAPVVQDLP